MKYCIRAIIWLAVLSASLTTSLLIADEPITCDHLTNQTTCNYFGVAQLRLTPFVVGDEFAVAFLGEFGPKSCRVNGTAGAIYDGHQIKFGAEYLGQKLGYNFITGKARRWVDQYAVGGRYQYVFDCQWIRSLYVDASSAYAGNQRLSTLTCSDQPALTVARRLAGSRYFDAEVGFDIIPWDCGLFSLGLGYNNLRYDKELDCGDRSLKGVSGSVAFSQRFSENLGLNIDAQFKRAYNFAEVLLDWQCDSSYGILSLGLFGGYVWGKTDLPSSTTFGVEVGFVFGPHRNNCGPTDMCCPTSCSSTCQDLIAWVSKPGVYIPTVLVTAEELVTTNCNPVTIVSQIPNHTSNLKTQTIDVTSFFTGDPPISYSLTSVITIVSPNAGPWHVTIDPQTGIITASVPPSTTNTPQVQITVTASNSCSSQSQTFLVTFQNS